MKIALMIPNVFNTLGPGNRLIIWTQGCQKRCKNCTSPELQPLDTVPDIDIIDIIEKQKRDYFISGVTISGGEPFLQKEELLKLVTYLAKDYDDILIYTGLNYEELKDDPICAQIFEKIAVLIDGEYIDELNENEKLRGSTNQRIIVFKKKYKDRYLAMNKEERQQVIYEVAPNVYVGVGLKRKEK